MRRHRDSFAVRHVVRRRVRIRARVDEGLDTSITNAYVPIGRDRRWATVVIRGGCSVRVVTCCLWPDVAGRSLVVLERDRYGQLSEPAMGVELVVDEPEGREHRHRAHPEMSSAK